MKLFDGFVEHSVTAARTLGRRAIFLGIEPTPAPSAYVHFSLAEPHDLLLPRSTVLVHHGRLGTALAAIRAGIPQLCVPQMLDQPANARAVARLGIVGKLPRKRYD